MPFQEPTNDVLRNTEWELVVIGRGVSAIVNCMTRRHCSTLPNNTLLVGMPDPWRQYADHPMGQHSALLSMPGYPEEAQTRDQPHDQFLRSRVFARNNRLQISRLLNEGVFQVTSTVEDELEFTSGKWLIPLSRNGVSVTISSKIIDICTGPGPGRVFHPGSGRVFGPWSTGIRDSFETSLLQQLRDNTGSSAMIGERFMRLHAAAGRVVVVGEGPLSASVVEHALGIGAEHVTWIGRPLDMANISFPSSTRYDNLIEDAPAVRILYEIWKGDIENGKNPNINNVLPHMAPKDKRLTILLGNVSGVQKNSATIVEYPGFGVFDLSSTLQTEHPASTPVAVQFQTLVVSASSENSESERRSAAYLLRSIPKVASPDSPLIPIEKLGRFVGLQVPDKTLRVLGTASRNRSLLAKISDKTISSCENTYRNWCESLSPQVQMPGYAMSITIAAAAIAAANEFYTDAKPDKCVQTVDLATGPLASQRRSTAAAILANNAQIQNYEVFPRTS